MWKFNKYNLGDRVIHKQAPELEFQVFNILRGEPQSKGNYLYVCNLVEGHPDELGKSITMKKRV